MSTDSALDLAGLDSETVFVKAYDDAVVYGDLDGETVLHEGPVHVLVNGWVELPNNRLLSPTAVHHIDEQPELDR